MALNIPIGRQSWAMEVVNSGKVLTASMKLGITRDEARNDPTDFLKFALVDDQGQALQADHTTRFYAETFEHCFHVGRHLSFITPPGFGKTTLALAMIVRQIGINPKLRTGVITADEKDSINAVTLARSIVLTDNFKRVYPNAKPDIEKSSDARGWRQTQWYMRAAGMRKDATMAAHAMEPKKESVRLDIGFFDDMITEQTADGEIHERICKRFYTTWIEGRCAPRGWAIYQQNVRRRNDLAHRLREDAKFCSVWIGVTHDCERLFVNIWNPPPGLPILKNPDRYEATPEPVIPGAPEADYRFTMPLPKREGWSKERLLAVNPTARRQLYWMEAVSSEDLLIPNWEKRQEFAGTAAEAAGLTVDDEGVPVMEGLDRMKFLITGGLDMSSTKRPGTCLWVMLKDMQGVHYPLFLIRGKFTMGEIERWLDRLWENGIHFDRLQFESNGVQEMIIKSMYERGRDKAPWLGAIKEQSTKWANKWGLALGLPSLDKDFEDGLFVWPTLEKNTGRLWAQYWNTFESMMETVTRDMADGVKTPDDLMAFLFARQAGRNIMPGPKTGKVLTIVKPNAGKEREEVRRITESNLGINEGSLSPLPTRKRKRKKFEY